MNIPTRNKKHSRNLGVTLVELLVVVAILSIITALLIPRLRIINKDRNIREAARIVGSTVAKASGRAIDDGVAGLIIERNPNFVDINGVYYAATRLYLMRKLPPFAGDDLNSLATVTASTATEMTIEIPTPLEHTASEPLVRSGDQIRLNYSSVRYQILTVPPPAAGKLTLTVSRGSPWNTIAGLRPALQTGQYPYVIYRQPKKLETSRVDLPEGYYIDLRLTGPLVPTPSSAPTPPDWEQGSVFDQSTPPNDDVQLFFNGNGSISSYNTLLGSVDGIPTEAFYFFVTGYDPDSTRPPLQNPAAMWVTTDNATGSTNVAYNALPPTGLTTVLNQTQYARGISKNRQSANQ